MTRICLPCKAFSSWFRSVPHLLTIALFCLPLFAQDGRPFTRFPSLSPDGETLAFNFQGDIWTVPVNGGVARRLTVHEAYESRPRWAPDGRHLTFNSDRSGNEDVWIMASDGSDPRRLTYRSSDDVVCDWTPEGRILFTSIRDFAPFHWMPEIYGVSVEGGTPARALDGLGRNPAMSPDGRFIALVRGATREWRKRYRGPADREIWLYDTKKKRYTQLTQFAGNDLHPRWAAKRELCFVSERNGTHNIFRVSLDNAGKAKGEPRQITHFEKDGVRWYDVAGNRYVMEADTRIFLQEGDTGKASPVDIQVAQDQRFSEIERKTFTANATEIAVSPNGKYAALVIRGELFLIQNDKEKTRTVQLTRHAHRDRDVAWADDQTLIFSSDREGQYDLYALVAADEDQTDLFRSLTHRTVRLTDDQRDERRPSISPDGKKVAFIRGVADLIVADYGDDFTLGKERALYEGWSPPGSLNWSPDSRWLAYAQEDLTFNADIYIQPIDGSRPATNITLHPRMDIRPAWSPDGTKLSFISAREGVDHDVWMVWLRKRDWEKTSADWEEEVVEPVSKDGSKEREKDETKDKKDKQTEEPEPITIDFEDIHERLVQVTAFPGDESAPQFSEDGKTIYFLGTTGNNAPRFTGRDVFKIKWDGTKLENVTKNKLNPTYLKMGPGFKHLFAIKQGGKVVRIASKGGKVEPLGFKARMAINHPLEHLQIFDEAWRALHDSFYDPDFHGADWQEAHDKYRSWATLASTDRDFEDVLNMMLGELNASHMGFYGKNRYETAEEKTGLLGAELVPVAKGVEVVRVLPNTPADRESSRLSVGDVITAVDGEKIGPKTNIYALLVDTVNEKVVLTVENAKGKARQVIIRPTERQRSQLYESFVKSRRALTEKYSKGRLGYVHIRSMNIPSFERFETAITASGQGKDGLVIDVRFNNGGWTTDYMMTVLSVRQHAFTIPRGAAGKLEKEKHNFRKFYPYGERLPLSAWVAPAVALCNEFSYSNAEIFSHAFKNLNRGLLIGQPTFGAVISTGSVGLIDGSRVRMPYRGWYAKATDQNMENGPAEPDILVDEAPDDYAAGRDPQLKRAVDELLKQIDAK